MAVVYYIPPPFTLAGKCMNQAQEYSGMLVFQSSQEVQSAGPDTASDMAASTVWEGLFWYDEFSKILILVWGMESLQHRNKPADVVPHFCLLEVLRSTVFL